MTPNVSSPEHNRIVPPEIERRAHILTKAKLLADTFAFTNGLEQTAREQQAVTNEKQVPRINLRDAVAYDPMRHMLQDAQDKINGIYN